MQYNININQKSIHDNFPELDLKDAVILDFILKVKDNPKFNHKIFNNKEYFWLSYSKIIEELPLIQIKNKDSLARRFKKLIQLNLLENVIDKEAGNTTYWRAGEEFYKLFFVADLSTQKSEPIDSKVETLSTQKSDNHNINNYKTNHNKKKTSNKFDSENYIESLAINPKLKETLISWLELRKIKKIPTSAKAINIAINKLSKYDLEIQIEMVENSIMNGWTGIFELKENKSTLKPEENTRPYTEVYNPYSGKTEREYIEDPYDSEANNPIRYNKSKIEGVSNIGRIVEPKENKTTSKDELKVLIAKAKKELDEAKTLNKNQKVIQMMEEIYQRGLKKLQSI